MEVESFAEGTLLKIVVPAGVAVPVQTTIAFIGNPGEPIPAVTAPPPAPKAAEPSPVAKAAPAATTAPAPRAAAAPTAPALILQPAAPAAPTRLKISPRALVLAKNCVINPANIKGTGPDGRIVEKDVKAYLASHNYDQVRISPTAKTLAAKEKLDILTIQGTGDSGRILVADVERAMAERPKPMNRMRQVIAQRLTQSIVTQPHFYVTVSVDMTDLIAYRSQLKAAGAPYTVTDFVSQAVVLSLQEFPVVNSSCDGKNTRWHSHVNLGLAVSIEGGLVVPVIRYAEQLGLMEICTLSKQLADKARAGKLTPDDMSGGTFTISNMGMLNVENFHAIINTGEGGILAIASAMKQPVVRDDKIVIRTIMKMTLSVDHRLIDGAVGAQFANAVKAKLENVELWKMLAS